VDLLATTNGGLEFVGAEELADLIGADADRHHRGAVGFEATRADVYDSIPVPGDASASSRPSSTTRDDHEDVHEHTRTVDLATTSPTRTSTSMALLTAVRTSRAPTSPTGSARPSTTATAKPPGGGCRPTPTTSPELLPLSPTDRYDVPYGRNDDTIVTLDR